MDESTRDQHNTKFLLTILNESGPNGVRDWYHEQDPERREYVKELLEKLTNELLDLSRTIDNGVVIPLQRKPKLRVIK